MNNKKVKEKVIESYLKKQCKEHDIFIIKNTGMRGLPDRLLIKNSIHIFVETKAPNETPRELQIEVCKKLIKHGAIVYVIDNKDSIDELVLLFDKNLSDIKKDFKYEW